jgi:hypothetical protein
MWTGQTVNMLKSKISAIDFANGKQWQQTGPGGTLREMVNLSLANPVSARPTLSSCNGLLSNCKAFYVASELWPPLSRYKGDNYNSLGCVIGAIAKSSMSRKAIYPSYMMVQPELSRFDTCTRASLGCNLGHLQDIWPHHRRRHALSLMNHG